MDPHPGRHRARERHAADARERHRDVRLSCAPARWPTSPGSGTPWCRTWASSSSSPTVDVVDRSRGPEWATWFTRRTINLAHQCVDLWAERTPEAVAVDLGRGGRRDPHARRTPSSAPSPIGSRTRSPPWAYVRATPWASILPMAIETVAAIMACSKLGAIWVPIFSGFGPDAVAARLADAGAAGGDHRRRIPAEGLGRRDEGGASTARSNTVDGVRARRRVGPPSGAIRRR